MSVSRLFFFLALAACAAPGCNRQPPVVAPTPIEVVISQPVTEEILDWDTYTGTVESREAVDVKSRVRGYIKDVKFKEGTEIPFGTELFIIDSAPFEADLQQARGELTTWEARLKLAEEKIGFYKKLADMGSISKEELLKVISDKGEAIGGIDSARGKILNAELNIGYCKITAPISGKVGEAVLTKGNLANSSGADSLLTTMVGVDPMYVYFYVNEAAYQNYRKLILARAEKHPEDFKGKKPKVPVELAVGRDGKFIFKGIVDFVDNRVDSATAAMKVRARFDNPKGVDDGRPLTVGLFARVRTTVSEPYKATLVAARAILSDQSLKYVLVVNKDKNNLVERVDIVTASRVQENGLQVVESGLKGNEWIIVEGVNRTRPGATVAPKDAVPMPRNPVGK